MATDGKQNIKWNHGNYKPFLHYFVPRNHSSSSSFMCVVLKISQRVFTLTKIENKNGLGFLQDPDGIKKETFVHWNFPLGWAWDFRRMKIKKRPWIPRITRIRYFHLILMWDRRQQLIACGYQSQWRDLRIWREKPLFFFGGVGFFFGIFTQKFANC